MRLSLCALALVLAACAPAGPHVVVQLVTDYVPGRDFDVLRVTYGARAARFDALVDRSYGRAVRVAELDLASDAPLSVTLALELAGSLVQAQPRRVAPIAGSTTVVTFLITRDCAGVSCPDAAARDAIACVGGVCVDPECSPEHPELCPTCAGGCPRSPIPCVESACRPEGVCFASARDDRCAAGETCVIDEGCRAAGTSDSDAGLALDADLTPDTGSRSDAGPTGPCTPVGPIGVSYFGIAARAFDLTSRPLVGRWVFYGDTGVGVSSQSNTLDGADTVALSPLATDPAVGATGVAAVTLPGTDDLVVAVTPVGATATDRHYVPPGAAMSSSPALVPGVLRQGGVATVWNGRALFAMDERALGGDPLVLRSVGATGGGVETFRSREDRDVALASRADGGALVALAAGASDPCGVFSIDAAGALSPILAVPVTTRCDSVALAELPDGQVALSYVSGARAGYVRLDAGLSTVSGSTDLGPALPGRMSITPGDEGSLRLVWNGGTQLSTVHIDPDGTLGPVTAITAGGSPDYAQMRSVRQGDTTGIVFPGGRAIAFAAVCD